MLNTVIIMGRLTTAPELKATASNLSVCGFCLAVNRNPGKNGAEAKTDFIDVVTWRNTADFVAKYFKKGQMMIVEGTLQTRTYEDKNGNKRKAVEVVARNVSFGESKRQDESHTAVADNIPAESPRGSSAGSEDVTLDSFPSTDLEQIDFSDDDLPF